jgi:hypothetical protein
MRDRSRNPELTEREREKRLSCKRNCSRTTLLRFNRPITIIPIGLFARRRVQSVSSTEESEKRRAEKLDSQNSGRSSERLTTCFHASSKSADKMTYLRKKRKGQTRAC